MRIINHKNNGVKICFDNGLVLSTLWGYCNYCQNYDFPAYLNDEFGKQENGSHDLEFMFTKGDEKLIKKLCKKYGNGENPSGYVPIKKWIEMISYINNL